MILFLPAAFLSFFFILRSKGLHWRRATLAAATFWGTSVVVITEILSVLRLLTRAGVVISWLTVILIALVYLRTIRRKQGLSPEFPRSISRDLSALDPASKALLLAVGVIVFLVGITALISAPNMWDAMEYHLPRVTLWMSNHSVRFFATPDYSQLIFGPWAEYAMMHAYMLWGGDRFVNVLKFFSMLGSVLGVSLISKQLVAATRG